MDNGLVSDWNQIAVYTYDDIMCSPEISYMRGLEMTGCVTFECHMQAHISGWVDSRLKYLLCISNGVAAVAVIVYTLYDSS